MSETTIDSLSFAGKTESGGFTPSPKLFRAKEEPIFSAVKVTVAGSSGTPGRVFNARLYITFKESGAYVNSIWSDVPENEPTTMGAFSDLSTLFPQFEYELDVAVYGFGTDDEDVSVTVDLLKLDTTVAEVTRDVIRKAESTEGVKAMAFGISEASFAHFMTTPQTSPEVEVGINSYLKMRISVGGNSFPYWPFVHIVVPSKERENSGETGEFIISGSVVLTFIRIDNGEAVAIASADLKVHCEPAMVTETKDSLQLQFQGADIVAGSLDIYYIDSSESGVLGGFPGIPDFEDAVNDYLAKITSKQTTDLSFAIPAYLKSRPLPDHWDYFENMTLEFKGFSYQTVKVHSFPISYLFIVFAVKSLGLPPPCYCEDGQFSALETRTPVVTAGPILKKGKHKYALPGQTDYSRFLAAAQVSAFGVSQQTFEEIARPYTSLTHIQSASTNGTIYASARFWYTTRLVKIEITSHGMRAVLDATGEGSAKAAMRDKCGHDVLSASAKLRIGIEGSSVAFTLDILERIDSPPEITIEAVPQATLGHVDVDFSTPFDPPQPLNQIRNWILETVITSVGDAFIKIVNKDGNIRFMKSVENNGDIRLRSVTNRFFENEAVVLLGQLWVRSWG